MRPPLSHTHTHLSHFSVALLCRQETLRGLCGIQFRWKLLRYHHWNEENLILTKFCLFRSHSYWEGWVRSVWGKRKDWSPLWTGTHMLQMQSLLQVKQDMKLSFSPSMKKCNFICEGRRQKEAEKTEKFSLVIAGECQREREIQFARSGGSALLIYQ